MKIRRYNRFARLEVFWQDIVSDPAWADSKTVARNRKSMPVKTMGYFLANNGKDLVLVHSITEDGDVDTTVIPWATIRNIDALGNV
jgi:hypothetical protein